MRFIADSISLRGRIRLATSVEHAFQFFSPLGEKLWVPGWEPEILHPPDTSWAEGQVFRTREEYGDAVWVVSQLDQAAHRVLYHRVEPSRYVARIEVSCSSVMVDVSDATVVYSFIGLSEGGNREISAMTQDSYDAKMTRWAVWLDDCLQAHRQNSAVPPRVGSTAGQPQGGGDTTTEPFCLQG